MTKDNNIYPFAAIVGQENMKLALILNVINPSLGGVLIRGEKGTAKSTAVRGLASLLGEIDVVDGCDFNCNPKEKSYLCKNCMDKIKTNQEVKTVKKKKKVVELPVSATEDRVVGTLNIETAIKKGEKQFEPGLLAHANGNLLYVDEVNLLDDHIVDLLLDSAAMGVNIVEREGVSYEHPARFVLVGTMNPEEGDLRPQLLDRFGLVVEIAGEEDPKLRKEVIKRRLSFEEDKENFVKSWVKDEEAIREKIINAQKRINSIQVTEIIYDIIVNIGIDMGVDGHRADITLLKTAKTLVAYEGKDRVEKRHVLKAAEMVLPHRMRRLPFEEGKLQFDKIEEIING
ncbi:MAG: ATP-binding protein [Eubacteriaceae bacterium]